MTNNNSKLKRSFKNVKPEEKWDILVSYIRMQETLGEIAKRHNVDRKAVEFFISKLYKRFQQSKETYMLMATQTNPDLFQVMKAKHVDSEHINDLFLKRLSDPTSLILSDNEIIFCELSASLGNDIKALEESKLTIGLSLKKENKNEYDNACLIRALYLKKKPNVAHYINEQRKNVLKDTGDGKKFVQESLVRTIQQIENSNDPRLLPSFMKAIEQYGRTVGAFEDKVSVSTGDGDRVLDMMLEKAKKVNAIDEDSPDLIAYVDGEEIYNE